MNYILLANGFEEIEAITVIDILRRAKIDLEIVSITNSLEVISDRSLKIIADITINDIIKKDINSIILPGGSGYKNLEDSETTKNLLLYAYNNNKYLFAICAAPSILGTLGLLNGKIATCYPGFEKYLNGSKKCSKDVCIDNKLITSRGPGTAHKFAYAIVTKLTNQTLSDTIKNGMLF
ncbi:MAG: DJ-1 family glyoxalase III [Bacillota bacterium]|nr:DJ-1 family glyoxalase III [Bacillota bacterium]